jgi:hypothetical protein
MARPLMTSILQQKNKEVFSFVLWVLWILSFVFGVWVNLNGYLEV